jgi:hypothetical protein
MLTCSGCRVARFCSADHQKMASKKAALGGSLTTGRHKDVCGVLSKRREVVKDRVSPESCTAEPLAFWQRKMHITSRHLDTCLKQKISRKKMHISRKNAHH